MRCHAYYNELPGNRVSCVYKQNHVFLGHFTLTGPILNAKLDKKLGQDNSTLAYGTYVYAAIIKCIMAINARL